MAKKESEALAVFLSPGPVDHSQYASARSLAARSLDQARSLDRVDTYVYTDPRHEQWVRELLPEDSSFELRLTGPRDRDRLTEKVETVFGNLFEQGYDRVVGLAADTPRLDDDVLRSAFAHLDGDDSRAVVGPSRDGGFYLVGLNAPQGEFLKEVPFYHPDTCERLVEQLAGTVDRLHTLRRLDDIDDLTDWLKLDPDWILSHFSWLTDLLVRLGGSQVVPDHRHAPDPPGTQLNWSCRAPPVFSSR